MFRHPHPHIEVVDPTLDPRVFVLLDKHCKVTHHGKFWQGRLAAACNSSLGNLAAALGQSGDHRTAPELVFKCASEGVPHHFESRRLPYRIECAQDTTEDFTCLSGELHSVEVDDTDCQHQPLTLSQDTMSALGMTLDDEHGTCTIRTPEHESTQTKLPLSEGQVRYARHLHQHVQITE